MSAPTFLLVAGFKDAPKAPERDYDADLDAPEDTPEVDPNGEPIKIPNKRGRTRTTNVSRAGIRVGTDPEDLPLVQGGFTNPVRRRVERMRTSSGFTPAEEAELKRGFAAIQGLMTGQQMPDPVQPEPEPSDEAIEAAFNHHTFVGGPRAQYCRQANCFRSRNDPVHA